jgi:hypothetical protein
VDHIIGYTDNFGYSKIGDLSGLSANIEEEIVGILDGGLSHYRIGGVIGAANLNIGYQVNLHDSPVGTISSAKSSVCVFDRGPSITSFLDDTKIRGLSCFIYPKTYSRKDTPQLILIPMKYGQFKGLFDEGDLCELRINNSNNMVIAG